MTNFNNLPNIDLKRRRKRAGRRDIEPASIKRRFLTQDLMSNTAVERVSATVPNGSKATLTTTLSANDASRRIGLLPYAIQVYIGTATSANILPSGSSVSTTDYTIYSWDVPEVTGGTDGNNIVRKTTVANASGSQQTIIFDVQARYLVSGPGTESTS